MAKSRLTRAGALYFVKVEPTTRAIEELEEGMARHARLVRQRHFGGFWFTT